eukprot:12410312-Karenia_brevis.AAC.1
MLWRFVGTVREDFLRNPSTLNTADIEGRGSPRALHAMNPFYAAVATNAKPENASKRATFTTSAET